MVVMGSLATIACMRDLVLDFCHHAQQVVRVEKGSGLTPDHSHTHSAIILAFDWDRGRHAAFNVTVTSISIHPEASMSVGAAALEAEVRKHRANDPKCSELGWVCVLLAVETYCNWGKEAHTTFSRLTSCIAITSSCHKSLVLAEIYGRLNFTLTDRELVF